MLVNVFVSPIARIQPPLDCCVLSGKTEGIPANWVHDVVAALDPVAGNDVSERVGLGVAHVQIPRWVRKHVKDILLGSCIFWVG